MQNSQNKAHDNDSSSLGHRGQSAVNHKKTAITKLTLIYTLANASVAGLFVFIYWALGAVGASYSLIGLVAFSLLSIPFHFVGRGRLIANLNLAATSLSLAGVVITTGGIGASAASWLLGGPPAIAAMVFRRSRYIFIHMGFAAFLYLMAMIWELLGNQVYYLSSPVGSLTERIYTVIDLLGYCAFITMALTVFARTQRKLFRKVEQKSRDLSAILGNIHQGIFTINSSDLEIGREYSQFLGTILDCKELTGKSIFEVFLDKTDIAPDDKAITRSILITSINDDILNFLANEDNLPKNLILHPSSPNKKYLQVQWQPILNRNSKKIEKILVSLLDITTIKRLQAAAKNQDQQLVVVGEILEQDPVKFEKFIRNAYNFLDENERILSRSPTNEDVKIMFINIHTLKGLARNFRFSYMSSLIHECEKYFIKFLNEESQWSLEEAANLQEQVRKMIDYYNSVYVKKLRRSEDLDRVSIEASEIERNISKLKQLKMSPKGDAKDCLESMIRTFYGAYYLEAKLFFEEIFESTKVLARDLGKPEPIVEIESQGSFGINKKAVEVLQNVFVHILRNTMDHGIEMPLIRHQKDKESVGKIQLEIMENPNNDELQLHYRDDGRGLDLERIFEVGSKKSLISDHITKPLRIANLIFHPGFSTSNTVTDISGRGVGMSAVIEYLKQIGGRIDIKLLESTGTLVATPFEFVISLPESCFESLEFDFKVFNDDVA